MTNENHPSTSEARSVEIVRRAIAAVRPDLLSVDVSTPLIGDAAVLDSVGFVTLLVAIEEQMDGRVDLAAAFLESGTEDNATNPFCTVGTLAQHLRALTTQARD